MRKVELRMNEKEKYNIIKNLVDNNGNKNTAAIKLHISRRQVDRLIIKYKENGNGRPLKREWPTITIFYTSNFSFGLQPWF